MNISSIPPTEPGWYWYKATALSPPVINRAKWRVVEAQKGVGNAMTVFLAGERFSTHELKGLWSEVIEMPREEDYV